MDALRIAIGAVALLGLAALIVNFIVTGRQSDNALVLAISGLLGSIVGASALAQVKNNEKKAKTATLEGDVSPDK